MAGIIGQIALWSASALLARRPGGLEQIGIFSVGLIFRQIVVFAPSILSRVALPLLCHTRVSAQRSVYIASVRDSVALNAGVAVLVAAALAASAPWMLSFIGRGFASARPVVNLLLASAVIEVIAVALYQPVLGAGKVWWHVVVLCGWAVCLVAGGILSAARTDASVLAGAYVAAWLVSAVAYGALTRRLVTRDEISG
jgi:O-antigen/teichoic acid export membrane protein